VADDQTFHDEIEGYCGRLSVRPGENVDLRVSTRAERYDVLVERWGATREIVWSAADLPGSFVAPPSDADSQGCRWPVSAEIPVASEWRSGYYLITLTAHGAPPGRNVAYACFVVRGDAGTRHRALLVLTTNTWNA